MILWIITRISIKAFFDFWKLSCFEEKACLVYPCPKLLPSLPSKRKMTRKTPTYIHKLSITFLLKIDSSFISSNALRGKFFRFVQLEKHFSKLPWFLQSLSHIRMSCWKCSLADMKFQFFKIFFTSHYMLLWNLLAFYYCRHKEIPKL